MSDTLIRDCFIFIPFIAILVSSCVVCRLLKIKFSVHFPFLVVSLFLSSLVLSPLLTLPLFGVTGIFYVYLEVLERRDTLVWIYLVWGHKREFASVAVYALISWLILGGLAGTYLSHRLFNLGFKKAVSSYFLTMGMSAIVTWLSARAVYHIWGFP